MTKTFCDNCQSEITEGKPKNRLQFKAGKVAFEVIIAIDGLWNGGHLCERCAKSLFQTASVQGIDKNEN